MKQLAPALLGLLLAAAPAAADGTLVPAAQALAELRAALGKQIDVRFSEAFVKDHLAKADFDGVTVYGVSAESLCLYGQDKGLEAGDPKLAALASPDGGGDVCVPLADVSVRVAPHEPVEGASPVPFYSTDRAACNWVWRQGSDLGLWTETCKFDTGLWGVTYNERDNLFALRVDDGEPYTVLQEFREPGGPPALLDTLKQQGLVLDDPQCQMAQVNDQPAPAGWTAWQVVPTGRMKEDFDRQVQEEIPDPPCGRLGYAVDSVGFFMVKDGAPDRILYANLGQDGTMIDLASIRFK
ncbi:hypothetical protein DK847_00725 [Aestuariivirga litoralis]|uniref:Uncharacterized protein n=1 Tax=Aestuariivirga litoralis TaxID=2650924 RepID=A0A2W2B0F6_9HYPH|nr:hypothetical protein [Aestuariivirga litoralis]PZF78380.1 hypothetical protein DK847_00725 [Aestuariivirga litoralis]